MRSRRCAAVALAVLVVAAAAKAQPTDALDGVRQQCIAAARDVQQRERAIASLEHQIVLIGRDAAGRQRGLDESRVEQQRLLGVLVFLARNLPGRSAAVLATPLDRLRSEIAVHAAVPALRAEAHALAGDTARVVALRAEGAAKQRELTGLRATLAQDRQRLALLVTRRQSLIGPSLPADAAAVARLGRDAKDVAGLIKAADAAADRRDREILARARVAAGKAKPDAPPGDADPTRPAGLRPFDPPQTRLMPPVAGAIADRFGAVDAAGVISQGLGIAAGAAAEATAPFDGQVVYAGQFGKLGLVLIIRHGRLYHSLLAGLGRVDVSVGQWVLAGEPVGAMPDAKEGSTVALYLEMRRDGQPVDPQPWLATGDGERAGDRD